MKTAIIINENSGASQPADIDLVVTALSDRMAELGWEYTLQRGDGEALATALDALPADIACLIVGGGDGTLMAGADAALKRDVVFGIIPLGTMNMLARDMGMPTDPREAIAALSPSNVGQIDVARVNGQLFLNAVVIGAFAKLAKHRENLRDDDGLVPAPKRVNRLWRDIAGYGRHTYEIEVDGEPTRVRAGTMQITNGPLARGISLRPERASLNSGLLGLYVDQSRTRLGFLRAAVLSVTGGMPDDPNTIDMVGRSIVIRTRQKSVNMTIDGEVVAKAPPLRFQIEPEALRILGAN